MSKKLYIYKELDVCDPGSDAYHEEGGLLVITGGYPNDAVKRGTGNYFEVSKGGESHQRVGLPEADLVIDVSDDVEDVVIAFRDSGCC